jgi:hypothetical protein
MTEHICPDCGHLVSEHKEFFCQHVYCHCNMGNVAAEAKYKLKIAVEALITCIFLVQIESDEDAKDYEKVKEALRILQEE